MKTTLVTPPTYYPITLDQVKDHLRIDHSNDEPYLQAIIAGAVTEVEEFTRRRLVTQTWKMFRDGWPCDNEIEIPYGQLQSITHVKYTGTDGTVNTLSTDDYTVDTDSEPGRVVLAYGETWPGDALAPDNPIEIQFVCGYGDFTPIDIVSSTDASPIVLTTAAHGLTANDTVYVHGHETNINADGFWKITTPLATTIGLLGSTGTGAGAGGATGTVIKQDLPPNLIHSLKLFVADKYEYREDVIFGTMSSSYGFAKNLLTPYILW